MLWPRNKKDVREGWKDEMKNDPHYKLIITYHRWKILVKIPLKHKIF